MSFAQALLSLSCCLVRSNGARTRDASVRTSGDYTKEKDEEG